MTTEATRLRELLAINRAITSTTDYEKALALVVEKTLAFTHADACLLLLAESGENVSIAASAGDVPKKVREAALLLDEHLGAGLRQAFDLGPEGAITAVPMIRGGFVRGSLVIVRRRSLSESDAAEEERERLLSVLADHASIVLGHIAHMRELRLAEAKASGILSTSADAVISIDANQCITMFNEGAERIFGYTKDEVLGTDLSLLLPESVRAEHRQHVEAYRQSTGTSAVRMGAWARTILGRRKSGEEFPADAAISKVEVAGDVILTVVLRDVTQQKRVENEQRFLAEVGPLLASSLDYDETLATIAKLAVRDVADLCIVDVIELKSEKRRVRVVSRDPEMAPVCDLLSRVDDGERSGPDLLASVLASRRPVLLQLPSDATLASFAQTDEHRRALQAANIRSMVAVPLMAHGELLGAIALISTNASRLYGPSDVALAEELARRAALSIENAALYLEARRATRARDDVLGIVAHDLRNPLNIILVHAGLLKRAAAVDPAIQEISDTIKRAVVRMNRLIKDLLDVTALDAGQLSVACDTVVADKVIADVLESERSLAEASAIELRLELPEELPALWADRDRLAQIFENLIGNALKFTRSGGRIRVGATAREGDVMFWVADTGSGIDAEHLPHVFDRFWQADRFTREGAGLGLPIVKGLIEAQGGRIWVESTRGQGTTFFFTLPARPR